MLIQGSNIPITIVFDASVESLPELIVTLWSDDVRHRRAPLKTWHKSDMTISTTTAVCPITEAETKTLPETPLVVEAKGLDGNGETVFWSSTTVGVLTRRDRIITLTQDGGDA